ncbi:ribosome small subunit-dependent GTPase A [Dechloromonas denitrificans]|uniref:ribosome small subunit-dependent GTPase A n=1 Tax=Azonexaceae TaxID=2008795 RepID=UPI001CF89002|nr:ribosome small subunit-dependent GTPase A [Dechloromonas denitrificans]UCV02203.1 ribosome small subunit-dependent GTPase A [Dechloromonas denitrificans]UCV06545.1 ribosome small subunit-dependent GTPase A [Dechloromonas denitrificans]
MEGRVIAAHGRQYVVELADGSLLPCFPRGKKSDVACGDRVDIERTSSDQGVIEAIQPRTSLLYRSNEYKQKLIAANVDQLVIVVATEPAFSDDLITRALLAAESEEIEALIVLNKCDLTDKVAAARERLTMFSKLGYRIVELSALKHAEDLRPELSGVTSVLVGQSGMGKSTLVNALVPEANAATREISQALDSGKHTTTHATLYHLDAESQLIDSPGLQEFGLGHLDRQEIEYAFREFRPWLGQCRFRDCHHNREPDCALTAAVKAGEIDEKRFAVYHRIIGTQRGTA